MMKTMIRNLAGAALAVTLTAAPAAAAEKVNVAIGQLGLWDTLPTVFADRNGYFKDVGLEVKYIRTRGGAETAQAVITGSNQFGLTMGVLAAISAYAKGAPVRIVASEMTGNPDLFWFVRTDSKLKTVKDINGAKIPYSRPGSGTHMAMLALSNQLKLKPKLISVGGPSGSRTQLMSGQMDAAWSVPPFGLDLVEKGKARILFTGDIVKALSDVTIRVNIVNADWLANNRDTAKKFMTAYKRGLEWQYGEGRDEATRYFAKRNKISLASARAAVKFYKPENVALQISNLDKAIDLAVKFKRIGKPLTAAQKKEFVQWLY